LTILSLFPYKEKYGCMESMKHEEAVSLSFFEDGVKAVAFRAKNSSTPFAID